ncbi:uncharacterized protein MEPE_05482 [Melanopsichium pennsylvanicum]|uniref:Uncharacterized protein n=2 Tax=Melanopsichium pennsylvanicum TaxID=63383 RepID=A0AAJ5C7P3_9BASI|nr:putative protein [Melanopsichium pennsylvanicum 4]SNX86773.1 uncharacterized protein MEPE_05482 [Melanopsichium pennsylvanicum]
MTPVISTTGQTRSRLPQRWMQNVSLKSAAQPVKSTAALQESPVRWSTHTLADDPNDTIRSRAESTTSTYVDTFAHRRKSRISDVTCVDHLDDATAAQLTSSESLTLSLADLSATLNNDDADSAKQIDLALPKAALTSDNNHRTQYSDEHDTGTEDSDDDEGYSNDMTHRIDRLMAATMEALEASNRLVLDTLSSRAKLAQLNAMEAALDSHLDAREAHLHRQIQAVTDMTEFVVKTSAELQKLTSPVIADRLPSVASSTSQLTTLADPAELEVRGAAATGIVQALDRDATIGKTAAKRLERMLQTPPAVSLPTSAASALRRSNNSTRRPYSISNFAAVQSSIAEEGQHEHEQDERSSTPHMASSEERSRNTETPSNTTKLSSDSRTSTPQKKRSISYDSRAQEAMKLMTKMVGPSRAMSSSGFVPSASALTSSSLVIGPSSAEVSTIESTTDFAASKAESRGSHRPAMRPSLMATLRPDPASFQSSVMSNATVRPDMDRSSGILGLPGNSRSLSLKASANVGTAAESTLAALLGMPSAASTSSRTETPSDSSYFDSAMEDSVSSASPPTPGSIHAIHSVLATSWKPAACDDLQDAADVPSSQERSARRSSMQYANLVSPRASLSLSDRDRTQQLSSQLAELRVERVTWNPHSLGSAETGTAGIPTQSSGAGGGGALRALQKLNEMSSAKLAGHSGASSEGDSSKRVSLGLGLPSFSALRPSASRSTSTTAAPHSHRSDSVADAAETPSSSILGGDWRSWAWNAAATPKGDGATPAK